MKALEHFMDLIDIIDTYDKAIGVRLAKWCWGQPIYLGLPVSIFIPPVFIISLILTVIVLEIGIICFLVFHWGESD